MVYRLSVRAIYAYSLDALAIKSHIVGRRGSSILEVIYVGQYTLPENGVTAFPLPTCGDPIIVGLRVTFSMPRNVPVLGLLKWTGVTHCLRVPPKLAPGANWDWLAHRIASFWMEHDRPQTCYVECVTLRKYRVVK